VIQPLWLVCGYTISSLSVVLQWPSTFWWSNNLHRAWNSHSTMTLGLAQFSANTHLQKDCNSYTPTELFTSRDVLVGLYAVYCRGGFAIHGGPNIQGVCMVAPPHMGIWIWPRKIWNRDICRLAHNFGSP